MLYYSAVGMVFMKGLINLSGLVMFSQYVGCDPMTNPARPMSDPSEVAIYYVIVELPKIPGLAGLFVAAIYAAVLRYRKHKINGFSHLYPLPFFFTGFFDSAYCPFLVSVCVAPSCSLAKRRSKVLFHLY